MKRLLGAAAMVALLASPVLARTPDQLLVRPTTIQEPTMEPRCNGGLDYAIVPLSWGIGNGRQPAYAMAPAKPGNGSRASAIAFWRSVEADPRHFGRHYGVYATREAVIAAAPILYRLCARAQ